MGHIEQIVVEQYASSAKHLAAADALVIDSLLFVGAYHSLLAKISAYKGPPCLPVIIGVASLMST